MASSFLADLPSTKPDSFTTMSKNTKKMPVQLSFDNDDAKVIKNVKESLLIQFLERNYDRQPGGDDTPTYRLKSSKVEERKKAKDEERKKSHKRKEEMASTSARDADDERPTSSKTRRVQEEGPSGSME